MSRNVVPHLKELGLKIYLNQIKIDSKSQMKWYSMRTNEMVQYTNKYKSVFVPDHYLKDSILLENPVSSNLDQSKWMDDLESVVDHRGSNYDHLEIPLEDMIKNIKQTVMMVGQTVSCLNSRVSV